MSNVESSVNRRRQPFLISPIRICPRHYHVTVETGFQIDVKLYINVICSQQTQLQTSVTLARNTCKCQLTPSPFLNYQWLLAVLSLTSWQMDFNKNRISSLDWKIDFALCYSSDVRLAMIVENCAFCPGEKALIPLKEQSHNSIAEHCKFILSL